MPGGRPTKQGLVVPFAFFDISVNTETWAKLAFPTLGCGNSGPVTAPTLPSSRLACRSQSSWHQHGENV